MAGRRWGIFGPSDYAGTDQGVDFRGAGAIPALDAATVTDVGHSSIVEGGTYPYIVYRLNAGPYKGQFVYVAENFAPTVHKGQHVKQGQSVGLAKGSYPYIEIGFNKTPTGWNAVAPLGGATAAGAAMKKYIYGLIGSAPPVTFPGGLNPAQQAASQVAGTDPLQGGINAVKGAASSASAVASFLGELSKASFWLRAIEVVGGFLILLLGLYLLTRQVGLGGLPEPPTPGLSDEALADLQKSPGGAASRPATRRRRVVSHELPSDASERRAAISERAAGAGPSGEIPF